MTNDDERLLVRRLQAMKSGIARAIVRFLARIGQPCNAKEIETAIRAKQSTARMALRRLEEAKIIKSDDNRRYVVRDSGRLTGLLHFVKAPQDQDTTR